MKKIKFKKNILKKKKKFKIKKHILDQKKKFYYLLINPKYFFSVGSF